VYVVNFLTKVRLQAASAGEETMEEGGHPMRNGRLARNTNLFGWTSKREQRCLCWSFNWSIRSGAKGGTDQEEGHLNET